MEPLSFRVAWMWRVVVAVILTCAPWVSGYAMKEFRIPLSDQVSGSGCWQINDAYAGHIISLVGEKNIVASYDFISNGDDNNRIEISRSVLGQSNGWIDSLLSGQSPNKFNWL